MSTETDPWYIDHSVKVFSLHVWGTFLFLYESIGGYNLIKTKQIYTCLYFVLQKYEYRECLNISVLFNIKIIAVFMFWLSTMWNDPSRRYDPSVFSNDFDLTKEFHSYCVQRDSESYGHGDILLIRG